MRTQFSGQRYVRKFDNVRICYVKLTELAMTKPLDYIYEGEELYWVEHGGDEYEWHRYQNKVAARVSRPNWLAGKRVDEQE
jgi:hypothetical protein